MAVRRWIEGDESGAEMVVRVLKERVSLSVPPLHRVPLRIGNVVELVGPSGSAKTQILIQAAVNCILPKEWNGVNYGGLERSVVFIDLDCRFDISRLYQVLKLRILEANGNGDGENFDALYATCMRRFLYTRCYNSFEFLATLKTMHHKLQKERDGLGVGLHLLMIDSIGAYHWIDRASSSLPLWGHNRKGFSLANVIEAVVAEVRKLLLVHPSIVIASKATIFGDRSSDILRREKSLAESELRHVNADGGQALYREYMPSAWQSFVTHRVFVRSSGEHLTASNCGLQSIYFSEWLLPSMGFSDKFIVKNSHFFQLLSFAVAAAAAARGVVAQPPWIFSVFHTLLLLLSEIDRTTRSKKSHKKLRAINTGDPAPQNGSLVTEVGREKKLEKSSKSGLQQMAFEETDQVNLETINALEAHDDKLKKYKKRKKNCKSSNDCEKSSRNGRSMQLEPCQPMEDKGAFLKGKAKKSTKKKRKNSSPLDAEKSIESSNDVNEKNVYQVSSGDDDTSKGMRKWTLEYHESRPGLKVLQQRIDDYITAHEAQLEQEKKEREAQAAEGGWTVVVHQKGRKKTTDAESGVTVGSVAQNAVEDKMSKKKKNEVGLDFYRFQRREARRNEVLMLQSKFEEDKKRIQQLRAARKFRPY